MACSKSAYRASLGDFTFDLYKRIISTQSNKNAIMSTTSIMALMTMLQTGARKDSEIQMTKVLRLENMSRESMLDGVREVLSILKGDCQLVELNLASKVYPGVQAHITHEFLEIATKHFGSEIKCLDYKTKPEESRVEINNWVARETKGKIQELLTPGAVTSATVMMVVNAIHFKGKWNEQFSESVTRKSNFNVTKSRKVQVDMMGKTFDKIKYTESKSLACKTIELPYIGKELGMVILLPDDIEGLCVLENNLTNTKLNILMTEMSEKKIVVNLPKFQLESSYELKDVLSSLGMQDMFDSTRADLSGIGGKLYVSQVIHKSFVEVNEEGTEAAAATAVVMPPTCCLPTMFIADHPFFFMIWDHRITVPLFVGRLTDP